MSVDSRYPIGKFIPPVSVSHAQRDAYLRDLEELPAKLKAAIDGLSEAQLDSPYRDGGWTVRQVIHHIADSHMHSYIRSKFSKSLDNPTIMPYDEKAWSVYDDAANAPVDVSLTLLTSLHARWTRWLRSLDEVDFARQLVHPENGPMTLDTVAALYSWHSRHHTAHITTLRQRMGW